MLQNLKDCLNYYDEKMQGFLRASNVISGYLKEEKDKEAKILEANNLKYGKELVTPKNNPRLYKLFDEVYKKLKGYTNNTLKRPKLYLVYDYKYDETNNNAFASLDGNITITFDAANLSDEIVKSIIAHEFGHIIFNHNELLILSNYILYGEEGVEGILSRAAHVLGLANESNGESRYVLDEEVEDFIGKLSLWNRVAEFTADNVACLYDRTYNYVVDFEMLEYNKKAAIPFKTRKDFIGYCYLEWNKHGDEYYEDDYNNFETHPHTFFRVINAYQNMGGKPFVLKKKRTVTFTYRVKNSCLFKRKKDLIIVIEKKKYRVKSGRSIIIKLDMDVSECTYYVEGDTLEYQCNLTDSIVNVEYDSKYRLPLIV